MKQTQIIPEIKVLHLHEKTQTFPEIKDVNLQETNSAIPWDQSCKFARKKFKNSEIKVVNLQEKN